MTETVDRPLVTARYGTRSPERSLGHADARHNREHQADPYSHEHLNGFHDETLLRCRCQIGHVRRCQRATAEDFACDPCRDWCQGRKS